MIVPWPSAMRSPQSGWGRSSPFIARASGLPPAGSRLDRTLAVAGSSLGPDLPHDGGGAVPVERAISSLRRSATCGRYLTERTSPAESFLIVGSEPEIYYYAERKASTRLVFTYPLTGPYHYAAGCARNSSAISKRVCRATSSWFRIRVAHGMVGQFTPSARAGHSASGKRLCAGSRLSEINQWSPTVCHLRRRDGRRPRQQMIAPEEVIRLKLKGEGHPMPADTSRPRPRPL